MKTRLFILSMILLGAVGMLALVMKAAKHTAAVQYPIVRADSATARVQQSGPELAPVVGDELESPGPQPASQVAGRSSQGERRADSPALLFLEQQSGEANPGSVLPTFAGQQPGGAAWSSQSGGRHSDWEQAHDPYAAPGPGQAMPVADGSNPKKPGSDAQPSENTILSLGPGLTVDLAYDMLMGYVGAGELVTASLPGGAYGAARADGKGFFFTPFFQTDGRPVDLVGGETIEVYANGLYIQTIQPDGFTGVLNVTTDQVAGAVEGLASGSVVTASLEIWAVEPSSETPLVTATVDTNGAFTAAFNSDLGPHAFARIEYFSGAARVFAYAYPQDVFNVDTFNWVFGFGPLEQPITCTSFIGDSSEKRSSMVVKANWPHGDYTAELKIVAGDRVEVELGGSSVLPLVTNILTAEPYLISDQVSGQAPAETPLRVFVYNWMPGTYTETVTTSDPSGLYTVAFPNYDLTAQDGIYVAYAAPNGSEVFLSVYPEKITAFPDQDGASGTGDAPKTPYTFTVAHAGGHFSVSGQTNILGQTEWADFRALGVDIIPGDVITLETPTWSGSMLVANLNITADRVNDRYLGSVNQPGQISLMSMPWEGWNRPANRRSTQVLPASTALTVTLPDQDVRDGMSVRLVHDDANHFSTRRDLQVRSFQIELSNGLGAPQYSSSDVLTATLYAADHSTIKKVVSTDNDPNPEWYWLEMNGEIAAGDWLSVTDNAGWSAWLQVPELTVQIDRQTDLITGRGPKGLLFVDLWDSKNGFGRYIPSDDFALDARLYGMDMDFGTGTSAIFQELNGDLVRREFRFPWLEAGRQEWGESWVDGDYALPGNTIVITVTNQLDQVMASGTTTAGTGWMGALSYYLSLNGYQLQAGDTVHMDFGSGYTDTLPVGELSAQADISQDLVTGRAPADSQLTAWVDDDFGGSSKINNIPVDASGDYTADFGAQGWDVKNGDHYGVQYTTPHLHNVSYYFTLPRPQLNAYSYNTNGKAKPGGRYVFGIYYRNDGDLAAQDIQVVAALPPATIWLADNSGVTPQVGAGGVVTWSLSTLAPGAERNIMVTVGLDSGHPTGPRALGQLCATVSTSTSGDNDPNNNSGCSDMADVEVEDVDLSIDKWPNPWDVVVGQEFEYDVQYCNNRSTAAGPMWLTDTLPAYTSFVSATPRDWTDQYWSEQVISGNQLQLYFPAVPGWSCYSLNLRLQADADAPLNTQLTNRAEISTPEDTQPGNNLRINSDARVSEPRYEMSLSKYFDWGVLTPGGQEYYKLDYYNQGNTAVQARITDTLPSGTSYRLGSARDFDNRPLTPALVTGDQVVWDVGEVGVNRGYGLVYSLDIQPTVSPGAVLLNCATIGMGNPEATPWDSIACDERTVQNHGPNLSLFQEHWWNGEGQIHFEVVLYNLGDQTVDQPVITVTYPLSTTLSKWYHNYWSWFNVSENQAKRQLVFQLERLDPGSSVHLGLNVDLTNPGQRGLWYTNTAAITSLPGDTNPLDNTSSDTAFSGGELDRVEVWVGQDPSNAWGSAQPGSTVTVLNRGSSYTALADPNCGGCWNMDNIGPVWPGDVLTVTAGSGAFPVIVHVPDPFTAQSDSVSEQVWGQIAGASSRAVRVEPYWPATGLYPQMDASGFYTATFTDIPRSAQGEVRFETSDNYSQIYIHRRYRSPDLAINVNYAHDWVNGNYEAGHTVVLTVTQSDGVTVKGTAQLTTAPIPWWNGDTGFETNGQSWSPSQPDIQPGDWVFGQLDQVYTTSVQIGTIEGHVDVANDRITGTLDVPWLSAPLEVRCSPWGSPSNAPQKWMTIMPDGQDVYTCAWDPVAEWDIQPGQDIGVQYFELDGDSVFSAFRAPSANLVVQTSLYGNPGEGGNLALQVQYINQGDQTATGVVITQTLEGLTYLENTSLYPVVTGTTPGGIPYVAYQLGALPVGDWARFDVFVRVDAPAGQNVIDTVRIASASVDSGNPNDKVSVWNGQVQGNNTHLNVGKGPWTGDPMPGGQFVWWANVCNYGGTDSSQVVITDTLPISMTLVSWWGQHPGWSEVSRDASYLVVNRPTLPSGWCSQVYMRFQVDQAVVLGTNIANTATIYAANDIETNDNQATNWVNINRPRSNLRTGVWWGGGTLVPGGEFRYHMNYANDGNFPVDNIIMTDTLPVSTTLMHIYRYDQNWNFLYEVNPTRQTVEYVVWEVGHLENGDQGNFEVSVRADPDAAPGTTLVNQLLISHLEGEDSYSDNTAVWTETLYGHGPNLRVTKNHNWGNNNTRLNYQIDFANVGDQPVSNAWITDTLPTFTTWDSWWNMGFDWNRLTSTDLGSSQLRWQFSTIQAGEGGWLQFNANLDDPNIRPRWYTNTVGITKSSADTNPLDNIYRDEAVLGEVGRVEIWVGQNNSNVWGEAQSGTSVTVTTASEQMVTWADPSCNGCWSTWMMNPIQPGDVITVRAGNGQLPVVITVPDPFDVQADSASNTVWGQIDNIDQQTVRVDLYGYNGRSVQSDGNGNFNASFEDIPVAGSGEVSYTGVVDYANVTYHRRYQASDLLLRVNYGHDWIQALYPAGHTVWITVTNSSGELKAAAQRTTSVGGAWGIDGFETQPGDWLPSQPDIHAGDWVTARGDGGQTNQVHVGSINGTVDIVSDHVDGMVTAPFSTTLQLDCNLWVSTNIPTISSEVDPNGGAYGCSWAGVYDIQPNENVAVSYHEPGGNQIINVFQVSSSNVYIYKFLMGQAGEGGNATYQISYSNQGNNVAQEVVITDTLSDGIAYLNDTAPFPHTGNGPVVWRLGDLAPQSNGSFNLLVEVDAPAESVITNTAEIGTSSPWDQAPPLNKQSISVATVQPNSTALNLGLWPHTGDPAPGYTYIYEANVCNNGSTSSSQVVLTNTLPVTTTLVSWWGNQPGWTELSRTANQLIVKRDTIDSSQCSGVKLLARLDAGVPFGQVLNSQASVYASNDTTPDDNAQTASVTAGNPYTNLNVDKILESGWPVPGGRLQYKIGYGVNGNVAPEGLLITDTLPANTTFYQANLPAYVTLVENGPGYLVWQANQVDANWNDGFQVILNVDPGAAPGSILTNTATIGAVGPFPVEQNLDDNTDQVITTLNPAGPNLKVSKTHSQQDQNTLRYTIQFENLGSTTVQDVWITDTLPVSTTYNGMWSYYWDMSRLVGTINQFGDTLTWHLTRLDPGDVGQMDFNLNFSNPGQQAIWFTNAVEIATPPGDTTPEDNHFVDVYVLREVSQVDLLIGSDTPWINGNALDGSTVTVQTAYGQYSTQAANFGGYWNLGDIGPIWPGDLVTVTAGAGVLPVMITAPDPFSIYIDSDLNQVWGQIDGAIKQQVNINGYWTNGYQTVTTDSFGAYKAAYGDIPAGGSGEVSYERTINAAQVRFHRNFNEVLINLWVNNHGYGVPAPGGNYTYHIEYANDVAQTASDVLITDTLPAGMTYLSDNSGMPVTVDGGLIVWSRAGLTGQTITFDLAVAVDPGLAPGSLLTNTIKIASRTKELNYTDNTDLWTTSASANDTHLYVQTGTNLGDPAPGSQYIYTIYVCNSGSTASSGMTVTNTLPISTTLIGWTGSSLWSQVSIVGRELVLNHPSVNNSGCPSVNVDVALDPNAPAWMSLQNRVVITASNDMENTDNIAWYDHFVGPPHINQWVSKSFDSGLVVPGSTLVFRLNYGFEANFGPGSLRITDTLPVSTTFMEAWRNGPLGPEYLTPVINEPGRVVFEFGSLTQPGYNDNIYIRLQVDPNAIPGTHLANVAETSVHAFETELGDNLSAWTDALLPHNSNLSASINGSWEWVNNRASFGINILNLGDMPAGPFTITDTYPVSMSLVGSISHWRITDWLDNPAQHTFTATVSDLDPGESVYVQYYTEMEGGGPIPGGRVFTNTLQVQQLPEDNNPANNQASITLFSGPDLYIQKEINPGTYMPGGSITYGLHIGNRSNTMSYSMQGSTRITDTLPAGLIYTGSSWGPLPVDGQTIVWDVGTIWAGWDNWIWVYAQISSDVPIGSVITNSAVIQSSSPADIDINPVNNTGQVSFQIVSPAYQLSKTAQGNLVAGTVLTYTLSVTNTGNLAGTNIQVYDPLPAGLTYYGSDGWFDGSGALYWTLSQLDPGQTAHTWVAGTLSCSAGQVVTNQNYQVTSSDQGVNSPVGPAHTITITAPALEASFTASPESDLMPGAQVGFTDQSTTNGAPIVSWQWDFGDGSPLEPERSPNHIFQNAGAYTVTLTITDPCGFTAAHQQMLVVTDLSIGNQDGYSQLSWTHLGPAVDHYEVWASTLPYFTPGDAGSTKLGELYGPFDPALDYADPLATIGDVEVNHFYVMRAVFGPGQPSALSNRVGELDYLLEETNSSDLNWIALSLDVGLAKSSDLITHIQNNSSGTITVASVEKWNVVAQNYQVYTAGGTDFDLQTGGIYRVAISGTGGAPRVWSLFGKVPPAAVFAYNLRETATSDMNWIMLPLDKYLIVDAAGLAADILAYSNPGTTVFTVETWNTTAQNYLVYSDTGSGFTVRFGYPYRITIDVATGDSSTWPAR